MKIMQVQPEVTRSPVTAPSVAGSRGALLFALAMLGAGLGLVVMLARQKCDGGLAYALDDAYIHLAIAKNLFLHGNWGISPNRFSTPSSSLAWPAAASAVFCFVGVQGSVYWVFNVLAASLAVIIPWSLFSARWAPAWLMIVMLGSLILATPMIPLAATGMEHLAHAVVSLLFLYTACQGMVDPERRWCGLRAPTAALLLAPLVTAMRYEGMFLIAAVAVLYVLRGQWVRAIAAAAIGMLPIVLAGTWFMSHGWFFFPASTVLKSVHQQIHSLADMQGYLWFLLGQMPSFPHMPALIVVVAISTFGLGRRAWHETAGLMGIVFLTVSIMHMLLGRLGWFYRYEAYLVYLGLVVLMLQWLDVYREHWAGTLLSRCRWVLPVLFVALAWPIGSRSLLAHRETPVACATIYQQQVQSAMFLREWYNGATVAANDVGAICFFADIDCVDLVGLADLDVAKATLAGLCTSQELDRVARSRGATIAIAHKNFLMLHGPVPESWIEVASLELPNTMIGSDPTVTFYGLDAKAAKELRIHFWQFESNFPADVHRLFVAP
jgi:hypothetical protein